MRYDDHSDRSSSKETNAIMRWISTRPIESWAFFGVGFIIARIIF
ncbi:MAG: hypothetical protein R3C52_06070 [Hyphomonadaceae bacterium]